MCDPLTFSEFMKWKLALTSGRVASLTPKRRAAAYRRARTIKIEVVRSALGPNSRRRRVINNPEVLAYKMRPDDFRDDFVGGFKANWTEMSKRLREKSVRSIDLEHFSLVQDPKGALDLLAQAVDAAAQYPDVKLNFIDQQCDDLSPYILLARLREGLPPIFTGGLITQELRKVVDAVGLRKPLRMAPFKYKKRHDFLISAFPLHRRIVPSKLMDKEHQLRPQHKEKVAEAFVDTLNEWLGENEDAAIELTADAETNLISTIGEMLDNAERHGDLKSDSQVGDWWIAGFRRMGLGPDDQLILDCSVSIMSLGTTISESLETASQAISDEINAYVALHTSKSCDRELLRTIMALQDGITRKPEISDRHLGGTGFMHLITTFATLGHNVIPGKEPLITIVSGNSCIRITPPYIYPKRAAGATGPRELWLNAANTRSVPPDIKHAFRISRRLPGTIVSVRFSIDAKHLVESIRDDDS